MMLRGCTVGALAGMRSRGGLQMQALECALGAAFSVWREWEGRRREAGEGHARRAAAAGRDAGGAAGAAGPTAVATLSLSWRGDYCARRSRWRSMALSTRERRCRAAM